MSTICLNMIVKNEAHVIRRCLASVKPFIDHWVIVDTGSTDGTQEVIRAFMAGIPGELHERPWRNFGHNRTEAIRLARGRCDYIFTIDADEVLELPPRYAIPPLTAEAYYLDVSFGGTRYGRVCLVSDHLDWRWVGVLHEYLEADKTLRTATLEGPRVIVHTDGARSQIETTKKYAADARVLEEALKEEPDNARYVFYLAQSYRDSQQLLKALETYQRRAGMGGWAEEVWYSLYQAGLISERLHADEALVMHRYLMAHQFRPVRAEALGQLARYCRERKHFHLAHLAAARAVAIPRPADVLFMDDSFYDWRCLDEYSIASYWVADYKACAESAETLLKSPKLPPEQRPRVLANLNFARKALGLGELASDPGPAAA